MATGGLATQTSVEASAGACPTQHHYSCRTVQPRGRGAMNQQRKCLGSPGEAFTKSSGGSKRKTNPMTNEYSVGQKLKSPFYLVFLPPSHSECVGHTILFLSFKALSVHLISVNSCFSWSFLILLKSLFSCSKQVDERNTSHQFLQMNHFYFKVFQVSIG